METQKIISSIKNNIKKSIVGNDEAIDLMLISLFAGGHVLLEDVPGTGKTMLVKSLAASVSCNFGRIQFTPDLLPSDITGINFFNMKKSEFEFIPGPVFSNLLLADEINRATPRTQSGLLECMEEKTGENWNLLMGKVCLAQNNPRTAAVYLLRAGEHKEVYSFLERCYRELEDYKQAYFYAVKQK